MTAASWFDQVASSYDSLWSSAPAGRLQREAFWRIAGSLFRAGDRVLDLGCGIGDDAVRLSGMGIDISAIDRSPEMVRIARARGIDARVLRIEDVRVLSPRFDGALSNFGAMNCVGRLPDIREPLANLIRPGGYLALCLMGRFCLWETVWYAFRGEFGKAARRWKGETVSQTGICLRYPLAADVRDAFAPDFRLVTFAGIGVLVPPSFVTGVPERVMSAFAEFDRRMASLPVFRSMSDHRLLVFQREERP
ncbi:MAG TPA: methyltransferase domain-containing protein [Bryobacteraceae bacterium]|nr:methyltransferase domain-containing protein [Bryobacteraceae bacterium]